MSFWWDHFHIASTGTALTLHRIREFKRRLLQNQLFRRTISPDHLEKWFSSHERMRAASDYIRQLESHYGYTAV